MKVIMCLVAIVSIFSFLTFATQTQTPIESHIFKQEDYLNHTLRIILIETRSDNLPLPMVVVTWNGAGADNNWSTGANWSTGSPPAVNDTPTFNGTSVKNCTIDIATPAFTAFQLNAGYTGTVTVGINQTASWGPLTIASGTMNKSTFNITFSTLTLSGGDLLSTSGTVTNLSITTISNAASAISWGSGTWTTTGYNHSIATTDNANWDAGTATVNIASGANISIAATGSSISEPEMFNVNMQSVSSSLVTYTLTTNWFISGTLTVSDTSGDTRLSLPTNLNFYAVNGVNFLNGGQGIFPNSTTGSFISKNLTISGNAFVQNQDGESIQNLSISTSIGLFTLVNLSWITYAPPSSILFDINPDTANSIVTMVFDNMQANATYQLFRDDVLTETAIANSSGLLSFAISGGWSNHTISIALQTVETPFDSSILILILLLVMFFILLIVSVVMANGGLLVFDGIFGIFIVIMEWTTLDYVPGISLLGLCILSLAYGIGEIIEA